MSPAIDPRRFILAEPNECAADPVGTGVAAGNRKRGNPATGHRLSPEAIADLRHRLPEYLEKIGVELRRQGARLVGHCPRHEDSAPSFAVFGANHESAGCYPCGWQGDVFALSQWLGRADSFPAAIADVTGVLGIQVPLADVASQPRPAQAQPRPPKPEEPFLLSDDDREVWHAARLAFSDAFDAGELDSLAADLGMPLAALRWCAVGRSGLGVHRGRLAYLYPDGIKLRMPAGHTPRFRWLCGKATVPWRFDWVNPGTRTVYLTEGESDCIALVAAGLENDASVACCASPGASFPPAWAPLFAGKRVVLCFDRDPAGQAATAKVGALLKPYAASEILTWKGPRP